MKAHRAAEGKKARGDLIPTIILWVMGLMQFAVAIPD